MSTMAMEAIWAFWSKRCCACRQRCSEKQLGRQKQRWRTTAATNMASLHGTSNTISTWNLALNGSALSPTWIRVVAGALPTIRSISSTSELVSSVSLCWNKQIGKHPFHVIIACYFVHCLIWKRISFLFWLKRNSYLKE